MREFWAPENNTLDNLFPACQPCNIHKGPNTIEGWRVELTRLYDILHRNYPTFRHAMRFGRVMIGDQSPVVFWFERCGVVVDGEEDTALASSHLR